MKLAKYSQYIFFFLMFVIACAIMREPFDDKLRTLRRLYKTYTSKKRSVFVSLCAGFYCVNEKLSY